MSAPDLDFTATETGIECVNALGSIKIDRAEETGAFDVTIHIIGSEVHTFRHESVRVAAVRVLAERYLASADAKAEEIALQQHRFTAERIHRFRELEQAWREEARRLLK